MQGDKAMGSGLALKHALESVGSGLAMKHQAAEKKAWGQVLRFPHESIRSINDLHAF